MYEDIEMIRFKIMRKRYFLISLAFFFFVLSAFNLHFLEAKTVNNSGKKVHSNFDSMIDISEINKVIKEDGLGDMGQAKIHGQTNPKNGEQITISDFSFLNNKSVKFQVEKGQCGGKFDCENDRERAELFFPYQDLRNKEVWLRVAFFIPDTTNLLWPMRWSIFQIMAKVNGKTEDWQEEGCRQGKNLVFGMVSIKEKSIAMSRHGDLFCEHLDFPLIFHLKDKSFAFGKWQDVILHIGFYSNADKGFMKVYANGKRRVNFKGSMYDEIVDKVSIRTGIYNTLVSKKKDRGKRVMYVDALGMGASCEDVADKSICDDLWPK